MSAHYEQKVAPNELLRWGWKKVNGDKKSQQYYHELAVQTGLINKVQTWQDLIQYINNNSMFDFCELVKKRATQFLIDDKYHLLAKGNVKEMKEFIFPTFPICVLIESVNANNKELFCERALLPPNTKRSDIEAKIEEAKASNLDKTVVQSYQLSSYQFTKLSGLPNLELQFL